jgi:L-arabinose isomerase
LVFNAKTGKGINVSMVDMGDKFRILVNEVESVKIKNKLPRLPVARVLLKIFPNFKDATKSWMLAGGSHHTVFSLDLNYSHLKDFCEMAKVEYIRI